MALVKLDRLDIDASEVLANSQSSGCTSTIVVQSIKMQYTYLSDYFGHLSIYVGEILRLNIHI